MVRLDLRENHRHRLRVLVLEVVGENRLVHVGKLLPHGAPGRTAQILHDLINAILRQAGIQETLRRVERAHQRAGARQLVGKLHEKTLNRRRADAAKVRHGHRKLADLFVVHHLEKLGGMLVANRKHEDGRLLRTRQAAIVILALRHSTNSRVKTLKSYTCNGPINRTTRASLRQNTEVLPDRP